MSLRPALKDHMRWVDQKFKEWDHWDEQVLDEMESSKQDFKRAGSTGELARMAVAERGERLAGAAAAKPHRRRWPWQRQPTAA